jgi:hypothetical protein
MATLFGFVVRNALTLLGRVFQFGQTQLAAIIVADFLA